MSLLIKAKRFFTPFRVIILGFTAVILLGSILLMLPCSSASGRFTPFIDAFFTSASAVCVTGLVVFDTATYWSQLGQFIIMLLIQIGGMGVITITILAVKLSGKKIGLVQRSVMQEAVSAPQIAGIVRLTSFIFRVTLICEAAGAALLSISFIPEFGVWKGIWYSVFHSVSAFCNAGFDLMGFKAPFSSLTSYADSAVVNVVIMLLIIVGGIGFLTIEDIKENKLHFKKYRLQSKVILTASAVLILLPAAYFFFCEFSRPQWDDMPVYEKLLCSLFQAVTPRTAGFNTVDFGSLTEAGQMIILILMLIGGSPGSTAGGMKTTTAAVLLTSAVSAVKRRKEPQCFGRRISADTVRNALTLLVLYLILFLSSGIFISYYESVPLLKALFETGSAIGTVGLSLGLTPSLHLPSKLILILLMLFGRVGGLTVIFAAGSTSTVNSKLPQEKIAVG